MRCNLRNGSASRMSNRAMSCTRTSDQLPYNIIYFQLEVKASIWWSTRRGNSETIFSRRRWEPCRRRWARIQQIPKVGEEERVRRGREVKEKVRQAYN